MLSLNLGGYLLLERWITPRLFDGLTETLPNGQLPKTPQELAQTEEGKKRIASHYKTFIKKADIEWLAAHNIKLIRVPFAPDIFDDAPALKQLDWLMKTTENYHIQVLLDLHTHRPKKSNVPTLTKIAERYRAYQNLWGIELLNEPDVGPHRILKLKRYYRTAYKTLTKAASKGTKIIFSDGFAPRRMNGTIRHPNPDFPVLMDCHFYHVFGAMDKRRTLKQHYEKLARAKQLIAELQQTQPIIVGEWSAMLQQKLTAQETVDFLHAQANAYETAAAHFYWTYKTEAPGRWNYRDLAEKLNL